MNDSEIKVYILRVSKLYIINYCYIVANCSDHLALLIDPAWEKDKIEHQLKINELIPAGILLTHHHIDHINLAKPLALKYKSPVYMSKIEIDYYHFKCPNLIPIEEFVTFNLANLSILPILTAGHTKGGTSYLIANNLFSGDTLFIEGCGLCSGKGGDPSVMFDTLQTLKEIILPDTIIFPGHSYGRPVGQPFAFLLQNNVYLLFTNRDDFIAFRMRDNQKGLFNFK